MNYLRNLLKAYSILLCTLLLGGNGIFTVSAWLYFNRNNSKKCYALYRLYDYLFWFKPDYCCNSYTSQVKTFIKTVNTYYRTNKKAH